MRTLTKAEWIAVVVGIVVVVILLGSRLIGQSNTLPVTDQLPQTDTTSNQNSSSTTTNSLPTTNPKPMNPTNPPAANQLIIKDTVVGTGIDARNGDLVSVQYTGKFADGKVFDSSIPRGKPIQFQLGAGQVIKGWDQGILGMKVGGKRTLTIPASLGYGANGYPPVIPPNATLYFDVELVGVEGTPQ